MGVRQRLGRALRALPRDERGTAITEFALVFGMYVVILMGTVQIALWAFTSSLGQFAVWEGCRAGIAAYQPPPPDGTGTGSIGEQQAVQDSEWEANAIQAASERTRLVLGWLPITSNFTDLTTEVVESEVAVGESGERDISVDVNVHPLMLIPLGEGIMGPAGTIVFERGCRLRLQRFYSF